MTTTTNSPIPRAYIPSLRGGAQGEFTSGIGDGLCLGYMSHDGSALCRVVVKDSAGRRKIAETTVSREALLRLHHAIGEALKLSGQYADIETQEQRDERMTAEAPRFPKRPLRLSQGEV